jgi:hypothetical protein
VFEVVVAFSWSEGLDDSSDPIPQSAGIERSLSAFADVFAVLFGSVQAFLKVRSWRSQNRHTELALTLIPRCAAGHGFLPVSGPI